MSFVNSSDLLFGPVSQARSFDFTLFFEDTILTIAPATLFLIVATTRILWLSGKPTKVATSVSRLTKIVLLTAFATVQSTIVIIRALNFQGATTASVAASTLDFVAACILFVLSSFEHLRSVAPSTIIGLYLVVSVPFDAVRLRTHFLLHSHATTNLAALLSLSLALKCIVLVTEAIEKRSLLLWPYQDYPPETTGSLYNKSVFWWINPLLKAGFGKTLDVEDLFNLDKDLASINISTKFSQKWARAKFRGRNTLLLTTGHILFWQAVMATLPRMIESAARFSQPFLNRTTINYIGDRDNQQSSTAWGIVGAYFLVFLVQGLASATYRHLLNRCATQVRGGLVALIYQKTLDLRIGATDPTASLTLMSSDIQRLVETIPLIHDVWLGFIDVCIGMFLLYLELGSACYAPAIVCVLQVIGTGWVTRVISQYQKRWLEAIQTRVSFTSALLHSIRNIKLLGLSATIRERTQGLRVDEIEACKRYRVMNNFIIVFQNSTGVFAPFATFLLYYLQARASGRPLDLATSFSILTILRLVETPLNTLCYATPHIASSIACFHRIQEYLVAEQWHDSRLTLGSAQTTNEDQESVMAGQESIEMRSLGGRSLAITQEAVVLKDCSFAWNYGQDILKDLDLTICHGQIVMVIGPVGSGKSTLIKGMLSETLMTQGFLYLRTKYISFADQEAWIQNGTIRDAIRGPRSWEEERLDDQWYQEILMSCALLEDLKAFPKSDMTILGSKGISLSGGQKQRIALARALYSKPDILMLDDVFSGLDNETEDHIFRNVFSRSGLVRRQNMTVIMVTHAAHKLQYADLIVSLSSDGRIAEQGNYVSLANSGGYVESLNIELKQERHNTDQTDHIEDVNLIKADRTAGISASQANENAAKRDLFRRTGDWTAYKYWFKSAGYLSSILSFVEASVWMGAVQTPGVLIKVFSEGTTLDTSASSSRSTTFIVVFGVTTAVAALSLVLIAWQIFLDMVPRSSRNLHLNLLRTVLDAPLSFFTRTDTGDITNRFSQDMGLIDADLPFSYADFVLSLVSCIAGLGLMSASGSGYFAAIIPILLFVLYLVQRYYLRTSRQMRLLDLEQKAPLYTMFAETSSGISTIRAFGWTEKFVERNLVLLDRSQRPFYLMMCIQRWLALVLDMIVVVLVTVLLVVIMSQRSSIQPGLAGIGLLSTVGLSSSLTNLVRMWSALETSIGAISRLREFLQTTESEHDDQELMAVRPGWPENGEVVFHSFDASYAKDSDLVLKDISLKIRLGEKVGICGRSGSGKSSMLASLFHLLEFRSGQVRIDGVDLATLPREILRSKLNVIPQEPWWITTETVRFNMDPWKDQSTNDLSHSTGRDEAFVSALSQCQVWQAIQAKGGLDAIMTSDFLSHGQRQLFCLARALLRQSKVVILDEVSANVDVKTDELMQQVIRNHFENCTIIAVAHRLNTIEDSDRVVVLSQGRIVEVDNPTLLLRTPGSRFKELYEK
ncbi:hypothetical protein LTR84_007383 [Exophiala bonariae]|uniref:ABC transporter n=1 Tax=Exophiala bonariae TaxID=1690606 RepID=A0AAV9MY49_9EURO|nr:hypothetical protein LTR84_007383 [Exophiala bonariae]